MNSQELENRLIKFAVLIIEIAEGLVKTKAGNHISGQMIRSGTSPALNYGEAQDAESRKDFIHKIKVVLKELRETLVALKIIKMANMYDNMSKLDYAISESNELVSIFVKSVKTAKQNV
ncbi:MAG: four helix bundle protein [Bacteroidota bacterium]